MKHFMKWKSIFLMTIVTFVTFSCSNDDDDEQMQDQSSNIVETAQNTESLSSLVAALAKADENDDSDLIGTLSGDGPFTVFAPTNDAFNALLSSLDGFDSLEDFDTPEERTLLATILQYHVIAGTAAASTDLSDDQELTTVQGENLTVSLDGGVFLDDATDNNAEVTLPDVMASNGIVHVINKVLLPQVVIDALNAENMNDESQNLVEIVVEAETLTVLEAAVIKAGLAETLAGDGPFTVFAPTDNAFVALLEALGDDYNSLDDFDTEEEIALLTDILLYHVVPAKVLEADLAAGDVATALADNSLEIIADGDSFVIGDASDTNANITATDIMASNGVAHLIDKVLLPQSAIDFVASLQAQNIVEIAIATDDLSLLVDALIAVDAGLVETLGGEGPFTVFAPTNKAFEELLNILGDDYNGLTDFDTQEEIDLLVDILTYHVVAGTAALSTDLSNGQQIETVNGGTLGIVLNNGVHIDDASDDNAIVAIPDVEASNGVVHIIDKVLLPQEAVDFVTSLQMKNIVELASENDDLSLLVEALVAVDAGLVETLSGDGPFTVFAPTNEAFVELLQTLGDDYNSLADFDTEAEIDLLVEILTYHVIAGTEAFSTDLSDGQMITTVNGAGVIIAITENGVAIEDATDSRAHVDIPDIDASNGVVHIIDKVLLPQEAVDFVTSLQEKNIADIALETESLSVLVEALVQADAGLVEVLSGEGSFTVFAPSNEAFIELLDILGNEYNSIADFDTEEEKSLLTKILTYHVIAGAASFKSDLRSISELTTVQGETIGVNIRQQQDVINLEDKSNDHTQVTFEDVEAKNGVVHIVNKVLLPDEVLSAL